MRRAPAFAWALFDCYVFSLAGWGELFGVGDVVWFQMVRGGGGLTGFLGAGKATQG